MTNLREDFVYGWHEGPDQRGTIEVLWTCVATTILCTYTILCLNCPARDESWWQIQGRKILWMGVAISGPEFILTSAVGQLAAARDSVRSFKAFKHSRWTYRHAFFANMGGFELVPSDGAPFRVNSKHIHYLVSRGHIVMPQVSDEELWDRSKQDTISRILMGLQAGYLIIQCIGRTAQGLALTSIELSTVAIVVCAIMTSVCWIAKPHDVRYPIQLHMEKTMGQVLIEAGPRAARPYRQTPLDFIDDLTPSWGLNVHPFMVGPTAPFERPIPRIGDSRLPHLTWLENMGFCFGTMVYAAIHLTGWNFEFPTHVERLLWRISSLVLLCTTFVFWLLESIAMLARRRGWVKSSKDKATDKAQAEARASAGVALNPETPKLGDNAGVQTQLSWKYAHEMPHEPRQVPLVWEFWAIFPIAVVYALARGYILIETLMGLRALPASAYQSVQWTEFLPHV